MTLGGLDSSLNSVVYKSNTSTIPILFQNPPSTAASLLFANEQEKKLYWDRSHYDSPDAQVRALTKSSTLYVGNLTFATRSQDLYALFSTIGRVQNVYLGLDRFRKTPCGFAFVEYSRRNCALEAIASLSGCKLLGRPIRVELDAGFKPGRQYGRGASGGQVRDDRRGTVDPARSGGGNSRASSQTRRSQAVVSQTMKSSGEKRTRDEVDDDGDPGVIEPRNKNPRFAGSDDEM